MCESKINHLKGYNLFGMVKSIKLETFETKLIAGKIKKGDKLAKSNFGFEELEFNINGNLNKINIYNSEGKLIQQNIYKYSNNQNLIEHLVYTEEGLFDKTEYYYDDKGIEIGHRSFLFGNILVDHSIHKYNSNGSYEKTLCYDNNGILDYINYETINENGGVVEFMRCKPDGTITERFESVFDELNREKERTFTVSRLWHKTVTIYDIWHNEVEEITFHTEDIIDYHRINEYVFDEKNNWIRKTSVENGVPKEIVVREIEYF